ncbi:hypothetical protein FACS1894217_02100 [Clostridia bacterium]|nr:hypothetical protein FACS1894217_02100 [Clostridia bacterium]
MRNRAAQTIKNFFGEIKYYVNSMKEDYVKSEAYHRLWIIGNGFDSSCQLPTSYMVFFEFYLTHTKSVSKHRQVIEKFRDRLARERDYDSSKILWSDLERKLGDITREFTKIEEFRAFAADIHNRLNQYLELVDMIAKVLHDPSSNKKPSFETRKFITRTINNIASIVVNSQSAIVPESDIYLELEKIIENSIAGSPNQRVDLYSNAKSFFSKADVHNDVFFVLNFTHNFENFITALFPNATPRFFYLHGEAEKGNTVMGVASALQIRNIKFFLNKSFRNDFVKANRCNSYSEILNEVGYGVLNGYQPSEIHIFGCSFGPLETKKFSLGGADGFLWWCIFNPLIKHRLAKCVVYNYLRSNYEASEINPDSDVDGRLAGAREILQRNKAQAPPYPLISFAPFFGKKLMKNNLKKYLQRFAFIFTNDDLHNCDEFSISLNEKNNYIIIEKAKKPYDVKPNTVDDDDNRNPLNTLVGLTTVKKEIFGLDAFSKIKNERQKRSITNDATRDSMSLHMVFTGNPGTGKTTVARLIGQIYKNIGLLSSGQVVEVDRSGLVAKYIGQTEDKAIAVINRSKGGVLFVDEAYELGDNRENDNFGIRAMETIAKVMEDNRDDVVVIIAGYKEQLEALLSINAGIRSRFNIWVDFPDYTPDECLAIWNCFCSQFNYYSSYAADQKVLEYYQARLAFCTRYKRRTGMDAKFANGREVRNLFEKARISHATRLSGRNIEDVSDRELKEIDEFDVPTYIAPATRIKKKAKAANLTNPPQFG